MKLLIAILLIVMMANASLAFKFQAREKSGLITSYSLLPASDLKSYSSAVTLTYPIRDRTALELDYLSLGNPFLVSESYTVTYRLTYGFEKWGPILPTLLFGWRFIYTPETDFDTPLDFGLESEINITDTLSFRMPVMIALFSNDNMLDFSLLFEQRNSPLGDFVVGWRNLKPVANSNFVERSLLILGLIREF
ncbi:hypothetical protein ACFL5U_02615 [Candidatus Margulisiibacteriota bacterium]